MSQRRRYETSKRKQRYRGSGRVEKPARGGVRKSTEGGVEVDAVREIQRMSDEKAKKIRWMMRTLQHRKAELRRRWRGVRLEHPVALKWGALGCGAPLAALILGGLLSVFAGNWLINVVFPKELVTAPFGAVLGGFFSAILLLELLALSCIRWWEVIVHYVYLPFLLIAMALIVAASLFCGLFLGDWDWLHIHMQTVLASPVWIGLAVAGSLLSVGLVVRLHHRPFMPLLWPLVLSPVVAFWALAEMEGFRWESLQGVFWSLVAIIFLAAPLLRWRGTTRLPGKPDTLGRRMLYRRVGSRLRLLVQTQGGQNRGVAVAVCGPWGSGKSHFINYLAYTLWDRCKDQDLDEIECYRGHFTVCSVDLWRCRDKESMWHDIAATLASAISGYPVAIEKRLRTGVAGALSMLRVPSESLVESILRFVTTGAEGTGMSEKMLNERIAFPRRAYILVLDNLDRCNDEMVNALFPVMERLRRIRGLITICAVAREELEKRDVGGVHNLNNLGETLIKVFDLMVSLPSIPVRHARAFMLRMAAAQTMECPNLQDWIMRQQLEFDTPRQMENIVNQLSMLDNCYLMRLRSEERINASSTASQRRFDAIFYMSALRCIFPGVAAVLEKGENPMGLLQLARAAFASVLGSEYHLKNGAFPVAWGVGNGENVDSRLLRSLLVALADCADGDLKEALTQPYLRLTALSGVECRSVIQCAVKMCLKPRAALNKKYAKEYTEEEEPALYRSVLEYALRSDKKLSVEERREYVDWCLKYDILPKEGCYHDFLLGAELAWQFAEARTTELNYQAWNSPDCSGGWLIYLRRVLMALPTSVLAESMRSLQVAADDDVTALPNYEYAPNFFEVLKSERHKAVDFYHYVWSNALFDKFRVIPWLFAYVFARKYFDDVLQGKRSPRCRKMLAVIHDPALTPALRAGLTSAIRCFEKAEPVVKNEVEENILREVGCDIILPEHENGEIMSYMTPTYVALWVRLRRKLLPLFSAHPRLVMMRKLFLLSLETSLQNDERWQTAPRTQDGKPERIPKELRCAIAIKRELRVPGFEDE